MNNITRLNVSIDKQIHRRMKIAVAQLGKTMMEAADEAMQAWIASATSGKSNGNAAKKSK